MAGKGYRGARMGRGFSNAEKRVIRTTAASVQANRAELGPRLGAEFDRTVRGLRLTQQQIAEERRNPGFFNRGRLLTQARNQRRRIAMISATWGRL